MDLLIGMIAGGLGANIAVGMRPRASLGFWINAVLGILGGFLAAFAQREYGLGGLTQTDPNSASLDPVALTTQAAAGGLGGAAVLALLGLLTGRIRR